MTLMLYTFLAFCLGLPFFISSPVSCLFSVFKDGYEQLSRLDGQSLKGIIRVKFVNEQV